MKRGASGLCGVLAIDKPAGMTSHDVVDRVRSAISERRVGHAGTLDPAATGLLVVCVGPATRLSPYLVGHDKVYRARISFGRSTATDDAEGQTLRRAAVPAEIIDEGAAARSMGLILGMTSQVPPAYSAIKRGGRKSYEIAREGGEVNLESRPIRVNRAEVLGVGRESEPWWDVELEVSKGTYVRSIARDVGRLIGTEAHLSSLRRVRAGGLSVDGAVSLDQLDAAGAQGGQAVQALFADPVAALGLPCFSLPPALLNPLRQGKVIDARLTGAVVPDGLVSVVCDGWLVSIHESRAGMLKARCVMSREVYGCPTI